MAWNCLAGLCVTGTDAGRIRKPINEESFMPWVSVTLRGGGGGATTSISVSNFSSRVHKAVVKSFQFGMSNGNGATIEIVDEEGGQFKSFFDKITKGNIDSATAAWAIDVQWGWVTADCDGTIQPAGTSPAGCCAFGTGNGRSRTSCVHRMVVRNVKCNVAHGMFKYSIEASDLTVDMFTTRTSFVLGEDGDQAYIVNAIRSMFKQWNIDVDFMQLNGPCDLVPLEWAFSQGKNKAAGPRAVCRAAYRNPIQAAQAWLLPYVSQKGKGWVTFWDSGPLPRPKLVFLEVNANCDEKPDQQFNLGTYIVNGGACSPVLSFTPEIQYVMEQVYLETGGTAGGALDPSTFTTKGIPPCNLGGQRYEQGPQNHAMVTDRDVNNQAAQIVAQNKFKNSQANILSPGITAELRVQGDPAFDRPVLLQGHYVTVVYFNPARIAPSSFGCDWTRMLCNDQLSSTDWMIWKVSHEIKEGSYSTTFKLRHVARGL